MGQTGSAWTNGSDCSGIWHHGTEARVSAWRVQRVGARDISQSAREVRERPASARRSAWNEASDHRSFWWHMEARVWASWPKIFRSCRSKAVEDLGIVSFLKLWANLHSFEGLSCWSSRVYGSMWRHIRLFLGLQFSGFVDRGPMDWVVASVL